MQSHFITCYKCSQLKARLSTAVGQDSPTYRSLAGKHIGRKTTSNMLIRAQKLAKWKIGEPESSHMKDDKYIVQLLRSED